MGHEGSGVSKDHTGSDAARLRARVLASRREPVARVTSTEAQNAFGRVLEAVARDGRVMITKHNAAIAVVMSIQEYEALTAEPARDLDSLAAEFDQLLADLQTPEAEAGLRDAFNASPDELGRAAVEAARGNGA